MPTTGSSCMADTPVWRANRAAGAASLRICASFVIKPQPNRFCVIVCPSVAARQQYSGLIITPTPLTAAELDHLLEAYPAVLYCQVAHRESVPVCSRRFNQLRRSAPQTRLRVLRCPTLLHALAISRWVLPSAASLDVLLHHGAPERWQVSTWQPSLWPHRWQLKGQRRSLSWSALKQALQTAQSMALIQAHTGQCYDCADFFSKQRPQAGRLLALKRV